MASGIENKFVEHMIEIKRNLIVRGAIVPQDIQNIIITDRKRITRLEYTYDYLIIGIDGNDIHFPIVEMES